MVSFNSDISIGDPREHVKALSIPQKTERLLGVLSMPERTGYPPNTPLWSRTKCSRFQTTDSSLNKDSASPPILLTITASIPARENMKSSWCGRAALTHQSSRLEKENFTTGNSAPTAMWSRVIRLVLEVP